MTKFEKYRPLMTAFFSTLVRYYDYALFGLSASFLSKNFMPGAEDEDQLLAFFVVFSLSTLARPAGSIIFGEIGDRMGRIVSVKIAVIMAALSTFMIAFIPGFNVIGWVSVVLLTICRMIFLMSLAGEIDAIKLYVVEKIGKKNRHFVIGIVSFSSQIGVLLASGAYHFSISFSQLEWLWRCNFIIGGLLGAFVIMARGKLQESEAFIKQKNEKSLGLSSSVFDVIKQNKTKLAISTLINGIVGGVYHFLIIFLSSFIAGIVGFISSEQASANNILLIIIYAFGCLISGIVADKIINQAKFALLLSIICTLIWMFCATQTELALWIQRLLVFCVPFYGIPSTIRIQSLFPINIRMRMCSLAHSLGSVLFSSSTPFICMLIWKYYQNVTLVIAYFLVQIIMLFFALLYI
jgi:MFS family permease